MKKFSPLFYTGLVLDLVGIILITVLSDAEVAHHYWFGIPLIAVGVFLIVYSIGKSKKEK